MKFTQCLIALWAATGLSWAVENSPTKRAGNDDLSIAIIESTLERFTPATIGGWEYFVSLYLMGQYIVYQRTGEQRYMTYIQEWADRWFDEDDQLTIDVDSLDDIQAGNVMLIVYEETGDKKYARAAKHLRDSLTKYPRTSDGAFWHALYWQNQIWADGTFMVNPFLQRYGHVLGEQKYVDDEATEQLLAYGDHLRAKNELLYHAWDESHKASWADPKTGLAGTQWCRAMGWYGLAITDILEILPKNHHNRQKLIERLSSFLDGVRKYQDPKTGRWYQVVDMGSDKRNWLETSCSAMFTYTVDIALDRGYIHERHRGYSKLVSKGYQGVVDKIEVNKDGLTDVYDIVVGTNVGSLTDYFNRPKKVNDLHGLGAVLLMHEQVKHGRSFGFHR